MKTIRLLAFLLALLPVAAYAQMSGADMYNPASATTTGSSGVSSITCDGTLLSCATTGAITLTTTNAPAYTVWGNATGSTAAPGYTNSPEVLNLTTSGTLTVSGNASLSGTTTISTLNFTNALGTTITDTTENTSNLVATHGYGTLTALSLSTTTFTPNLTSEQSFSLALTASCPCGIANPTNVASVVGQTGMIEITQPTAVTTTVSWGSDYKFAGGTAPVLSTTTGASDFFSYLVFSTTGVVVSGGVLNAK